MFNHKLSLQSAEHSLYKQPEKATLFDNPLRYDSPPADPGLNSAVFRQNMLDPHYTLDNSPYSPYSTESPLSYSSSATPQSAPEGETDFLSSKKKKKQGKSKLKTMKDHREDETPDDEKTDGGSI